MMAKIAPVRFVLFVVILLVATSAAIWVWHPVKGIMAGFDLAALAFLGSCWPLLDDTSAQMRRHSKENDANRAVLLGLSVTVTTVVLVAVGAVIAGSKGLKLGATAMIVATLILAWVFGNVIYALHYAHMYYQSSKDTGGDAGGIAFPRTEEPNYWDFIYFAFTLGMTFQTADCDITAQGIRRVVIGHCLTAFVFNLGVLAFTINALGS